MSDIEKDEYKNLYEEIVSISDDIKYSKWATKKILPDDFEYYIKKISELIYFYASAGGRTAIISTVALDLHSDTTQTTKNKIKSYLLNQGFKIVSRYDYIIIRW